MGRTRGAAAPPPYGVARRHRPLHFLDVILVSTDPGDLGGDAAFLGALPTLDRLGGGYRRYRFIQTIRLPQSRQYHRRSPVCGTSAAFGYQSAGHFLPLDRPRDPVSDYADRGYTV